MDSKTKLKDFTFNYSKINTDFNSDIKIYVDKITDLVELEKENNKQFKLLNDTIKKEEFENTLKHILLCKNVVMTKFNEYKNIKEENGELVDNINQIITDNTDIIENIFNSITEVKTQLNEINNYLNKYNS